MGKFFGIKKGLQVKSEQGEVCANQVQRRFCGNRQFTAASWIQGATLSGQRDGKAR
jgi:hypothetical protein